MYSSQSIPKPIINLNDIEQVQAMREARDSLKKRLELMDDAVGALEIKIITQLDSGADTSHLGLTLLVHESSRRYPAWKEHFIARLGKTEADAVLESTNPSIRRTLIIK